MKTNIITIAFAILVFAGCKKTDDDDPNLVTISMGNQYVYDVYYSFSTGVVKKFDKTAWDLSFSVPLQTASIGINEGTGIKLYSVGDKNDWNSVDTSIIKNKIARYNDKSNWLKGAFNLYTVPPFNFGWGTYNMATHNVIGDSIYFIQLADGSIKKLFIKTRVGATDTYELKYADANGLNEVEKSFSPSSAGSAKNTVHFSLATGNMILAEPDKGNWDLLFTVYYAKISTGTSFIEYPVMGVLANQGLQILKVTGVAPETATLSDATGDFSTAADAIGYDWKINDPVTHEYSLAPNTCYFVKQAGGTVYKIYFKSFEGSSTGNMVIKTELVQSTL